MLLSFSLSYYMLHSASLSALFRLETSPYWLPISQNHLNGLFKSCLDCLNDRGIALKSLYRLRPGIGFFYTCARLNPLGPSLDLYMKAVGLLWYPANCFEQSNKRAGVNWQHSILTSKLELHSKPCLLLDHEQSVVTGHKPQHTTPHYTI